MATYYHVMFIVPEMKYTFTMFESIIKEYMNVVEKPRKVTISSQKLILK